MFFHTLENHKRVGAIAPLEHEENDKKQEKSVSWSTTVGVVFKQVPFNFRIPGTQG